MISRDNYKKPSSVLLLSILCAFFLDIKAVNWGLVYGGFLGNEAGIMNTLFPVTIVLISIIGLFNKGANAFNTNTRGWLLILYLIVFYFFSTRAICPSYTSTSLFLGFTIAGIFIPLVCKVDAGTMLKAVMLIPVFSILRLNAIFVRDLASNSMSMDVAYGYAVPVSACLLYYSVYFKGEKGLNRFLSIVAFASNLVFLGYLILFGSRGPLVGIFCLFLFLYIVKYNESGGIIVRQSKKITTIFIILIGILFFIPILSFFGNMLSNLGVNLYFLDKMLLLQKETGDLSNGRGDLASLAINGFLRSPLFGNGFDSFNAHTGMLYPHNFILQLLYDGGILLFTIIVIPSISAIKRKYKYCNKDEFAIITFLFFTSVPGALFSQDMWMIGPLWFFVGYLYSNNFVYTKRLN